MLYQCNEVGSCKGRITCGQFIENNTQTPQIRSMIVGLLFDDLWGHVQWSSLQRREHFCLITHGPGKSKIAKLDHTIAGHQNILRFHVPVGNPVTVDIMQSPDQLLSYFSDLFNLQTLIVLNYVKELTLAQFCNQNELS